MGLFQKLTTEGLEEVQDRLGGFAPFDTDIYTGTIKVAYAGESAKGAQSVTVIVEAGGREYRETVYITNRNGENWFLNKQDKSKKVPLPGFTTIDDLCLVTSGKPLMEQATEEKILQIWDPEQKKEMPKSVPVLTELLGEEVSLGIIRQTVSVNEKQGDEYVATDKTRDENIIDKVFHTATKMTVAEAKQGAENPVFWDAWLAKNKGNTRDKTEKNTQGGRKGAPGGSNNTAPQASGGQARKSLFATG